MAPDQKYVLVTAAYNEAAFLPTVIASVVSQVLPPYKWVIVSDGSTDGTDEMVRKAAGKWPFIELVCVTERHGRDFAAQVNAINIGFQRLSRVPYEFIGNLDADISFDPGYFHQLLQQFANDANLGLAGGFICEEKNGSFQPRPANRERSVPHAVQFFRRQCFEAIGGAYLPLKYGGPDWHAEVMARMQDWKVQSFADLPVRHHRPTGMASGALRYRYGQGKMDYSLGSYPPFEVIKCLRRFFHRPVALGAVVRLVGFTSAAMHREELLVAPSFREFLQTEQKQRLSLALRRALLLGHTARGGSAC